MINIVFKPCSVDVKGASGYCYRQISLRDNPSIKVSNIEDLSDDMQLEMFKRIDEENESLLVLGGDCCSLLRKIFIEENIGKDGYILPEHMLVPKVAKYGGFTFEYIITLGIKTEEDFECLRQACEAYDKADNGINDFYREFMEKQTKRIRNNDRTEQNL